MTGISFTCWRVTRFFSPITTVASGLITLRQPEGEKVETGKDFIFLGSKITADSDFNQEIKRCLFLGWIAMTNLDSVLQSRDITLLTKDHLVKVVEL